jgi:hypothetical protein
MKQLKKVLTLNCLLVLLVLAGCANTPFEHPDKRVERQKNACMPSAILMREALKKYNIWSQVVVFSWKDKNNKKYGHAYCFYEYPKFSRKIWSYDNDWGSWRVTFPKTSVKENILEANYRRKIFGDIIEYQTLD